MKQALRNTIISLKEKNAALEARVKELERQVGGK
jgi:BMFP domain-containing protein YqiC